MVSVYAIRLLRFFNNYCLFFGKKLEQEQVESEQDEEEDGGKEGER
jgi:hypothetical protein